MDGLAPRALEGFADVARKGDIDFEAMRDAVEKEARETWRLFAAAVAGTPKQVPLGTFLASSPASDFGAEALRAYQRQPRVAAFTASSALQQRLGWGATPDDFPDTEEEYVHMCRRRAGAAFAFVENGEWHETATVGWFGQDLQRERHLPR